MTLSGYVLETSVRGYYKASLGNLFWCCIALLVKKFSQYWTWTKDDYSLLYCWELLGSAWLHHLHHCLPTCLMKPGQFPWPLLAELCPRSPTILHAVCLNLSGFSSSLLNLAIQSWTSYSSEASPAWVQEVNNFFFIFLCTDPIFSKSCYQLCHSYTERTPLACIEPGAPCCPFGRASTSALLSQALLAHRVVLPWVQYSKFLLAAFQEASSPLTWSL